MIRPGRAWAVDQKQQKFFLRTVPFGRPGSIAAAIGCVAIATLVRVTLDVLGPTHQFGTYYAAVLVAALMGGWLAGLVSLSLSIIVVWYVFVPPVYSFGPIHLADAANFLLFALSSLFIVWLANAYRRILGELERRESERALLVGEVEHRSKNILAVVGSLVNQTINDKAAAEILINRIRVAANVDDLLNEPGSTRTNLRTLIVQEVQKPNGEDRIVLGGPADVDVSGAQARALRIVLHEMSTNALKYGALSTTDGQIKLNWMKETDSVTIVWREVDGPKASAPAKFNFGSKLITATLRQIDARFEPTFAEQGYAYKIMFKATEQERPQV